MRPARIIRARPTGFVLLIAGDSPQSRRAIDNLRRFTDVPDPARDPILTVDGLRHPRLVAEYRVATVPALLYLHAGRPLAWRQYGDLADTGAVTRFLRCAPPPLPRLHWPAPRLADDRQVPGQAQPAQ